MFYYFYQPCQLPFNYYNQNCPLFFPQIQQNLLACPINPYSQTEYKEKIQQPVQKIILTKEDLLLAGYQTTKKVWTEKQDQLLLFLYEKKKLNWCQISKKIPQRNKKMCYSRYRRLKYTTKIHWLKKDNDKLLRLVEQHGQNWDEIIKHFKRRNIRQIKDHYNSYLRPGIVECEWNLQDDLKLIQHLNQYGKNWKVIEEFFRERSLNQIKNRYYGRIKKLNDKKLGLTPQKNFTP